MRTHKQLTKIFRQFSNHFQSFMQNQNIKLVVVGDGAIGKTCMLISYATNSFPYEYVPTVFDNYSGTVTCDGVPIVISLWDTAGQEDYDKLRPLSYPRTDVFLVCFSVVSPVSFANISSKWLPELAYHAPGVPYFLVGTKVDLRDDPAYVWEMQKSGMYPISTFQAADFAFNNKAVNYMECSALTQKGLRNLFESVFRFVLDRKEKMFLEKQNQIVQEERRQQMMACCEIM